MAKNNISFDTYLVGIGVSPGVEIGQVFFLDRYSSTTSNRPIQFSDISHEIKIFRTAIDASRKQLQDVKNRIVDHHLQEHVYIIDTHLLILDDKLLLTNTEQTIKNELVCAESALKRVLSTFREAFAQIEDEYLRERQSDLDFVGERILRNITGFTEQSLNSIPENSIIIARDLSPADTLQIDKKRVMGFATDFGGKTSHTAILARSMELPAVVGLDNITSIAPSGTPIIIDGTTGTVILNPSDKTLNEARSKREVLALRKEKLLTLCDTQAQTTDNQRIELKTNIELLEELSPAKTVGANGIGLFRTEFLYMNRDTPPDEEEQYKIYATLAEEINPYPVTIRTLDIGGDKFISDLNLENEMNPALGLRAIRFSLYEYNLFKTQLRAIYRASAVGKVRILFPMIATIKELEETLTLIEEVKAELSNQNIHFNCNAAIGVMIEVPSAALISDHLAQKVDFFSVGTNDLIQYTLAADRANEHVAYLYDPLNPAILRLLKIISDAASNSGIDIGICGEMAGDPLYSPILIGLGFTELSMSPSSILQAKKAICSLNKTDCTAMVNSILELSDSTLIKDKLEDFIESVIPELLEYPDI